jgi:hypothetical protein
MSEEARGFDSPADGRDFPAARCLGIRSRVIYKVKWCEQDGRGCPGWIGTVARVLPPNRVDGIGTFVQREGCKCPG